MQPGVQNLGNSLHRAALGSLETGTDSGIAAATLSPLAVSPEPSEPLPLPVVLQGPTGRLSADAQFRTFLTQVE